MIILREGINTVDIPVAEYDPLTFKKDDEPLFEWEQVRVGTILYVRQKPSVTFRRECIHLDCFIRIDGQPYLCGYSHTAKDWFAPLVI